MDRRLFLETIGALLPVARMSAAQGEQICDVAVIGGGVGGVAAALAALRMGVRVVLTEETDWIGGQLTAQAVPPDEHPWIEKFGCTRSYRRYRNAVRDYYREHYPVTGQARAKADLNPGNGSVSKLAHEPRVSFAVLEAMLASYRHDGQLTLLYHSSPVAASMLKANRVGSITVQNSQTDDKTTIVAKFFIDATETGELLPLTKTEFITGAESHAQTGEPHAPSEAQPRNVQSFTCCFAMDYLAGEDHRIEKPRDYQFWRDYMPALSPPWTGKLLSWACPNPQTLQLRKLFFDPRPDASPVAGLNLWIYRRILDPANFLHGKVPSAISLVNWPQNDYWLGDLLSATPEKRKHYIEQAKQLSLSWLYWMQREAPGPDGKQGWKGLRLRKDVVDTADGLAKTPYIRESRRIQAEFTVLEQHVGLEARRAVLPNASQDSIQAAVFFDTVGIGSYRLDLHPSTGGNNYIDIPSLPFQIPMGALIPRRVENLLAGCKNLGVTHITNGCYRLHPVEWNIGEAAGTIAAFAIKEKETPRGIRNSKNKLQALQDTLAAQGFELKWPSAEA
jgi:hypothetical protein